MNTPNQLHFLKPNSQTPRPKTPRPKVDNGELTTNGICKKFIHGNCKLSNNCPHPHDKSKTRPCNKYSGFNTCGYGEKCNFRHDKKICPDYMKSRCNKGQDCPFRHVYKTCPNYDMGFCFEGKNCSLRHISRKLCFDYAYGYCERGVKCNDFHAKVLVATDFLGTKKLFEETSKNSPQTYICNYCAQIGHKVGLCPAKIELEPQDGVKCGLCGIKHPISAECNSFV